MPEFKFSNEIKTFLKKDMAGGTLLIALAFLAIVFANTPVLSAIYKEFLTLPVHIRLGELEIAKPLVLWINDGLMAIFFFMTGLEIKKEIMVGELSTPSQVMLPGLGAIAGIAIPAAIYFYLNQTDPIALRGWAIPSATDIAFAVGIFSLFKTKLPLSLKLFLLSVAIFDDIGAIIIIALFYSSELSTTSLMIGILGLGILSLFNYYEVRRQSMYVVVGVIVWTAVLKSGVHATLAGFAVALFIPLKLKNNHGQPMLPSLEHDVRPWVNLLILPLFAFANAGVSLSGITLDALLAPLPLGIAAGLFLGKQFGIFGVCFLAIKCKLAKLPQNATWLQFYAVCVLCGIGFTMSLFIGALAFENYPEELNTQVKVGVLLGSIMSALLAIAILMSSSSRSQLPQSKTVSETP